MPLPPRVVSINTALARPVLIGGRKVMTAIHKQPRTGPVEVRPMGLEGDEQADPTVHGGLSKAVYAYPVEHYAFWQTVRAQARVSLWEEALPHGAIGENLTITGVLESELHIGDILRFPNCSLAVSEPRYPCFKFNQAMGFPQAAALMTQNAWCGAYLSVRVPGRLQAGDPFEIVPGPREVGIVELFRARMARKGH